MAIDAVVFDLDSTLAVPTQDRETLLAEAATSVGAPPLSRERYLEVHRHGHQHETRQPIFAELLDEYETSVDPTTVSEAYRTAIIESIEPIPSATKLIKTLQAEYRVGLLTNGPVKTQREKLEKFGWRSLFDSTVITGALDAGKPSPHAFTAILNRLAVPPEAAVYIGDDIEMDIAGAADAGMYPIQVWHPDGPPPDPRAVATVDREVLATDLPRIIRSLDILDIETVQNFSP